MNIRSYAKWGFVLDMLRVWPRVFMVYYFLGGWFILRWYLDASAATWDKSAFATVYASLGLPLMKWYMDNGVDWQKLLPMFWPDMRYDDDDEHNQRRGGGRGGGRLGDCPPTEGAPPAKPPLADRLARADQEVPVEIEK